jgi:hypothetical protein
MSLLQEDLIIIQQKQKKHFHNSCFVLEKIYEGIRRFETVGCLLHLCMFLLKMHFAEDTEAQ